MREDEEVIEAKIVPCGEEYRRELIEYIRTTMQRIADDKSSEGSGEASGEQVRMVEGAGV